MNFEEIIQITKESVAPYPLEAGCIYTLLDAEGGLRVIDTDDYATVPRRVRRNPLFDTPSALTSYLAQRGVTVQPVTGGGYLEVFANLETLTVVAVIDGGTGWKNDQATMRLRTSDEWEAWVSASGKLGSQIEFAEFLEDQLSTIAEPDGAILLEIVQSIQGTSKAEWTSAEWLANGQRGLSWVEEVEAKAGRKGRLEIPASFTLGLRPFVGSDERYKVTAALRYRINQGRLAIGFKLLEPQRVIEQAFAEVVETIATNIPTCVLAGRP